MNSKLASFVTCIFVILVALALEMPQAGAQNRAAQADTRALAQEKAAGGAALPAVRKPDDQVAPQPVKKRIEPQVTPLADEQPDNPKETVFYNGVKMEVMREADGPRPKPNAIVQIQYIGYLEDGTEFDRSYSRRYPSIYKLSDVIGCWQTGIPEMNVGSKVRFTCPPGSANGKRPVDFIWGDTTLYFIVELIAIVG